MNKENIHIHNQYKRDCLDVIQKLKKVQESIKNKDIPWWKFWEKR